jgi:mono/diheme cytochrome c family protein
MKPNFAPTLCTVLASLLLAIVSVGCRGVRRGEPFTGPLDRNDPKVQRGALVFARNCNQCHPGGEGGVAPALNDKPAPVWLMKTQVRVGLGAMPRFSKEQIPPEDLDDLMAYVIALRKDR